MYLQIFWKYQFFNISIFVLCAQAHLPEIKVHAYFAPVTPPPSVHGGGQRLCRCCIILWQWRARGGHLCLQVLLLWWGLTVVWGWGRQGRWNRREEGLDPLLTHCSWSIHRLIPADPWSVDTAPPLFYSSPISVAANWEGAALGGVGGKRCEWLDFLSFSLSISLFLPVQTQTGRSLCNAPRVPEWPPVDVKDVLCAPGRDVRTLETQLIVFPS